MSGDSLTIKKATALHRTDLQFRRLSPRTLDSYAYMLTPFTAFLQHEGVQTIGEVRPGHIRDYLLAMQARGLSPATQNTAAKCIKAWLRFLVKEGVLDASPMRSVLMPKLEKKRPVSFTPKEVETMLEATSTLRNKAMMLFLLDTGVRRAELVALNVGDVDVKTGVVHVIAGKGGKDRSVFLGARSRLMLRKYLTERGNPPPDFPLWASLKGGGRLSAAGVRTFFRRLRDQTGIKHCRPHTFRRTCALWCLKRGMDVYQVAAIMGHSDISTLRHYLYFLEDDLAEAHRQYSPVNGYLKNSQEGEL